MGYYTKELFDFLRELSANNNRPWFQANKARFDHLRGLWLEDLQKMLDSMSEWEPGIRGMTAKESAYRIYRDIRFSLDKTPYKVYFSASMSPTGHRMEHYGGYYLQMDIRPGETGFYGGIWQPDSDSLKKLRNAIVDNIEEFEEIIHQPELESLYPGWVGERLKSAPKGWPKDHPQIEFLRLKDYGKFHTCDESFFYSPDWPERSLEIMSVLKPLIDFLNYSLDEDTSY